MTRSVDARFDDVAAAIERYSHRAVGEDEIPTEVRGVSAGRFTATAR